MKKSILLVDDSQDIQVVIRKFLENFDIDVEVATNGEEALSYIQTAHFNLVLLDLHLPDLSGYEVIKKIKKLAFDTPVYAFTALDEESIEKAGLQEFGFAGCVSKDFISIPLIQFARTISELLTDSN